MHTHVVLPVLMEEPGDEVGRSSRETHLHTPGSHTHTLVSQAQPHFWKRRERSGELCYKLCPTGMQLAG